METMPAGIIYYDITKAGHVYISSIVGGYVETKDDGTYFDETEVKAALQHRSDRIAELQRGNYKRK